VNKSSGSLAEDVAVEYLKSLGYRIRDRNWRTRTCEIDIIAEKQATVYFVEVKYRRRQDWGTGLEYVTPKKQDQMTYAAEKWVYLNDWRGSYELSVIAVAGSSFSVQDFISRL